MPPSRDRLTWAEAKTRECRKIALKYFGTALKIQRKADRSPVTAADRAIEEFLRRELGRAFPGEAIVGEEFGSPDNLGDSFWTLDPIDGTRAFSRGLPSWGILISWVERRQPAMGACDFPALKTFIGADRRGAFERDGRQRRRLPQARRMALDEAAIFHGGLRWWVGHRYEAGFRRVTRDCYLERAYGDCYAYLWVFRGKADAMIDAGVKIWDIAPMAPLAAATGRVLIDFDGAPSINGPDTLLAEPSLSKTILTTLKAARD